MRARPKQLVVSSTPSQMAPFPRIASFLLVLLGLLSGDNGQGLNKFISSTLPNVCPYTKFCSLQMQNQRVNFNRFAVSCCTDCSCETSCIQLGNCCPDVQQDDAKVTPGGDIIVIGRLPCSIPIYMKFGEKDLPILDGSQHGINFYRIVTECSPDAANVIDIQKCKAPDLNSVNDSIVVSDNAGRVYKNRNCAKCNGVHKYTTWHLKLLCEDEDQFFLFDPLMHPEDIFHVFKQHGCHIYSVPPTPKIGAPSRCFNDVINSCNETGRWMTYDENVEKGCDSITLYYIDGLARNKVLPNLYKNPYCFLCNQNNFVFPTHVCMIDGMAEPLSHEELGIFSTDDLETTSDDDKHVIVLDPVECPLDEMHDRISDKCRKLFCPPTMQPVDGACHPAEHSTTAIQAKMTIHFANDSHIATLESMNEEAFSEFSESIFTAVQGSLNWARRGCEECGAQVIYTHYTQQNVSEDDDGIEVHGPPETAKWLLIILTIRPAPTNGCPVAAALDIFKPIEEKPDEIVRASWKLGSLAFVLNMSYESINHTANIHEENFAPPMEDQDCDDIEILEAKFYCPSFEIDPEELTSQQRDKIQQTNPIAVVVQTEDLGASVLWRVCVADYFGNGGPCLKSLPLALGHVVFVVIAVTVAFG